jgi:lipoprotein-anchoring transpeptidase ErfK/SrfK
MSRSNRISKSLIGVLGIVLVLAVVAYVHNTRNSDAAPQPGAPAPVAEAAQPAPVAPTPVDNRPKLPGDALVTSTPTALAPAPAPAPAPAAPAPAKPADAAADWKQALETAPAPRATVPLVPADRAVAEGKARIDAGDLLAGREILNSALASGKLTPADQKIAKELMTQANQAIVFSSKPFADDPWQEMYTVQSGDLMVRIANRYFIPHELISRLNNNIAANRIRPGQKLKMLKGPMHGVVSKSNFTFDLYLGAPGGEGSMYVCTFPVGLGAEGSTPTGLWNVPKGAKARNPVYYSPRGEGIISADDPKNPLGEYWIAIEGIEGDAVGKTSFGIHGTIEPESIGRQASMGCIRLRNEDVKQVFEMLYEVKSNVRIIE